MRKLAFLITIALASAASAAPRPTAPLRPLPPAPNEEQAALRERMGQRQLDLLIASIVSSEPQTASRDTSSEVARAPDRTSTRQR